MAKRNGKRTRTSPREADESFDLFISLPAALSDTDVSEMESAYREDRFGMARRIALATLAKPTATLVEGISKDRDVAVGLASAAVSMKGYLDHLKAVSRTVRAARMRIDFALCAREDMKQVIAEAEASCKEAV